MGDAAAEAGEEAPGIEELWFTEERTDVTEWLCEHGWEVSSIAAHDLMDRYHRPAPGGDDDPVTLKCVRRGTAGPLVAGQLKLLDRDTGRADQRYCWGLLR
jgi:O-methyltransferase involved in polyketide biosynthesis